MSESFCAANYCPFTHSAAAAAAATHNTTVADASLSVTTSVLRTLLRLIVYTNSYVDIFPVSAVEPIQAGDRIFIAASIDSMLDLQTAAVANPQKGLTLLDVDAVDLPGNIPSLRNCYRCTAVTS
eukprot:2119-Heterococcus_DN1.PRE.2